MSMSFAPVKSAPKSTDYDVRYGINGTLEQQVKHREFIEKYPFLAGCDELEGIGGNLRKSNEKPFGCTFSAIA